MFFDLSDMRISKYSNPKTIVFKWKKDFKEIFVVYMEDIPILWRE